MRKEPTQITADTVTRWCIEGKWDTESMDRLSITQARKEHKCFLPTTLICWANVWWTV